MSILCWINPVITTQLNETSAYFVQVKVEKFLTPEQRKQKELEDRLEAERKAREKKDNWRERGLDKMMGGVLEIKKEDELKKDIPKPAFMTVSEDSTILR